MPTTPTRLLTALGLAALLALPAAAQSYAGRTLRLVPHADLSIIDPHFSGVYITRNFGYLVTYRHPRLTNSGAVEHRER